MSRLHQVMTRALRMPDSNADFVLLNFRPINRAGRTGSASSHSFITACLCGLYGIDQEIGVIHFQKMRLASLQIVLKTTSSTGADGKIVAGVRIPVPTQTKFIK